MRPEERDPAYLWDMLEAAQAVRDYTGDLSLVQFLEVGREMEITRLAVERRLEIMREAARRISSTFREEHPEIPWMDIIGLRNVISHEYDKVNYAAIYRIVCDDIPELIELLEPLMPSPPLVEE